MLANWPIFGKKKIWLGIIPKNHDIIPGGYELSRSTPTSTIQTTLNFSIISKYMVFDTTLLTILKNFQNRAKTRL